MARTGGAAGGVGLGGQRPVARALAGLAHAQQDPRAALLQPRRGAVRGGQGLQQRSKDRRRERANQDWLKYLKTPAAMRTKPQP